MSQAHKPKFNFSQYVENLNNYLKEHPEAKTLPVVYSKDTEGNEFDFVLFYPSIGKMELGGAGFLEKSEEDYEEFGGEEVVCIN